MYINRQPTDNGNYGNPRSNGDGLYLADSLLDRYIATMGFAILTLDGDTVTAVEVNADALNAYMEEHPIVPPEPEQPTQIDRIEAQTMYTALITDTLLEE